VPEKWPRNSTKITPPHVEKRKGYPVNFSRASRHFLFNNLSATFELNPVNNLENFYFSGNFPVEVSGLFVVKVHPDLDKPVENFGHVLRGKIEFYGKRTARLLGNFNEISLAPFHERIPLSFIRHQRRTSSPAPSDARCQPPHCLSS